MLSEKGIAPIAIVLAVLVAVLIVEGAVIVAEESALDPRNIDLKELIAQYHKQMVKVPVVQPPGSDREYYALTYAPESGIYWDEGRKMFYFGDVKLFYINNEGYDNWGSPPQGRWLAYQVYSTVELYDIIGSGEYAVKAISYDKAINIKGAAGERWKGFMNYLVENIQNAPRTGNTYPLEMDDGNTVSVESISTISGFSESNHPAGTELLPFEGYLTSLGSDSEIIVLMGPSHPVHGIFFTRANTSFITFFIEKDLFNILAAMAAKEENPGQEEFESAIKAARTTGKADEFFKGDAKSDFEKALAASDKPSLEEKLLELESEQVKDWLEVDEDEVVQAWYCEGDSRALVSGSQLVFRQLSEEAVYICYEFSEEYKDKKAKISVFLDGRERRIALEQLFRKNPNSPDYIGFNVKGNKTGSESFGWKFLPREPFSLGKHSLTLMVEFEDPMLNWRLFVEPKGFGGEPVQFEVVGSNEVLDLWYCDPAAHREDTLSLNAKRLREEELRFEYNSEARVRLCYSVFKNEPLDLSVVLQPENKELFSYDLLKKQGEASVLLHTFSVEEAEKRPAWEEKGTYSSHPPFAVGKHYLELHGTFADALVSPRQFVAVPRNSSGGIIEFEITEEAAGGGETPVETTGAWVSLHNNLPPPHDVRSISVKVDGADWDAVKALGTNKLLIYNLEKGKDYSVEYVLPDGRTLEEEAKPTQTVTQEQVDAIE